MMFGMGGIDTLWTDEVRMNEDDLFYTGIVLSNTLDLVNSLGNVGGVRVPVSRDPGLR
jgi:hypothetical protein